MESDVYMIGVGMSDSLPQNDGGPAFGGFFSQNEVSEKDLADAGLNSRLHPGMSLRDWFAGQALACGVRSHAVAYEIADEFLEERAKTAQEKKEESQ